MLKPVLMSAYPYPALLCDPETGLPVLPEGQRWRIGRSELGYKNYFNMDIVETQVITKTVGFFRRKEIEVPTTVVVGHTIMEEWRFQDEEAFRTRAFQLVHSLDPAVIAEEEAKEAANEARMEKLLSLS